jgi:hypothetical protein
MAKNIYRGGGFNLIAIILMLAAICAISMVGYVIYKKHHIDCPPAEVPVHGLVDGGLSKSYICEKPGGPGLIP